MSQHSASSRRRASARRSNFRSIRVEGDALVRRLRSRHTLWLHGGLMGLITLLVMWGVSTALRHGGVDSLAVRYALALGAGYLAYLLLLRIWAGMLVREEERDRLDGVQIDVPMPGGGSGGQGDGGFHSGGGGDFGGGGVSGSFDGPADVSECVGDAGGDLLGDVASSALELACGADEGALVVIPVLAVFGTVLAVVLGGGWLLLLYFGSEAPLAVAVELAFAYTAARTVVRVEREGWLLAAIRLSWKPLLGALVCAVALGVLVDHFAPQADTLPQAVQQWRAR
jgi:hypothetical protein